ncbi:MAG TPA: 4-alpha-glucanotransferase [Gemmatimonadales bacterium]|nr:4-alpha-glucanotransferase [Gemmatimonadales bacterium]HSB70064.1 4-alpha-glucanotransferase [Candidatus Methylomirabilis sp.]
MRTDAWGMDDGYEDAFGHWRPTSAETRARVRRAMGADPEEPIPGGRPRVHVIRPGQPLPIEKPAEIVLEDGTVLPETSPPPELPLGYHQLRPLDGTAPVRLIVAPDHCHLPEGLRAWGWAVQAYAVRSAESWGFGDLGDLWRLGRWSATTLGAGFLLVNPLHAATPVPPLQPSPYCPSSRLYRNPLYIRIEQVPGATAARVDVEALAAAARVLNRSRRIHHDRVWELKLRALEAIWKAFGGDPAFDGYCRKEGEALERFAAFSVLAERHGPGWRRWPEDVRDPISAGVARFAAEHADRIRFHQWLQWLLDRQLARVAAEIRLVQDLPVGIDPDGADAWAWQDLLASGATVGAPPDRYNTAGQDWGLAPFVPSRLRAAAYDPFIRTIRATLEHAGGLRIDHAMGLFRLFWIPAGGAPAEGTFVRYPADDLLAIVALESHRAGAIVVAEDLGTVEPEVRDRLAAHRMLSWRVLWFETEAPASYPRLSLASVTTHDLPTIAGLWTGSDLQVQRDLGLERNAEALAVLQSRLGAVTGLAEGTDVREVIVRTHERVAEAPSVLVAAALDDALAVEERPNLPATTGAEWPSWSLALPVPLEALEREPLVRKVAAAVGRGRAGRRPVASPEE